MAGLAENFQSLNITNKKPAISQMNQTMPTSKQFLYEPAKYGTRVIKKWQEQSGQNWYKLSPNSRKQANQDLELLQVSMNSGTT